VTDPSPTSPWAPDGPVTPFASRESMVTLVEGHTFCLSGRLGDIDPAHPEGLFVLDTRVLSRWELRVDTHPVEPLAVARSEPFSATFAGRVHPPPGKADAEIVVFRDRHVGQGMRERLRIQNFGAEPAPVTIEVRCEADFADLFQVKEGRVRTTGRHSHEVEPQALRFGHTGDGVTREMVVSLSEPATVAPGHITWERTLAPGERWELCLEITVSVEGTRVEPLFHCGGDDALTVPARKLATWRAALPVVETDDPALAEALDRSSDDLGSLRIFDPEYPDQPVLAAGAPWFMTVFGRDSLLTAWMTLLADPSLARGVLQTLARFQGEKVDPASEEQPGKILHEIRFGRAAGPALASGEAYYGSVDATPLFVMLLGELRRWGFDELATRRLLPHADRALEWIERYGDRDGDGYVEYERAVPSGLANQGWKDSWDGIRFADGSLPQTPVALCEVQGYVYGAYLARAHLAADLGDHATCERYRARAIELRRRFNEDFWLEEHGWYALGLDADKRPIDALASNMGHCLWTGIVEPDRAALIAEKLVSSEMFSGWGVRTLATSMTAFNPVSYHNGSVWPHDNALCASGLARYGHIDAAHRIIRGQLAVAAASGGRLPELFAGFDRDVLPVPAAYPTSCSPQAWAAAAPLLWLRVLLRVDPWHAQNTLFVDPALPEGIARLDVSGITVGAHRVRVRVEGDDTEVTGHGDLRIVREPRPALSALIDGEPAPGS
jgi:glycogen debranching enzyme